MNIEQLIQSANSPDEVALLLSAMGQTGSMAAPTAAQQDPMNLPNARAAELLLTALGQTSMPSKQATPIDSEQTPIWRAQGQFFADELGKLNSVEAARALLNSMGQTGSMSEKVPMSPETSAGFAGSTATSGAPLSAEEQEAWH